MLSGLALCVKLLNTMLIDRQFTRRCFS